MQLAVITKKKDINAAQRQLLERIRAEGGPVQQRRLGFPGGQMESDVCYVERLSFWHATGQEDNRWWNGFGMGDPEGVPMLTIVAEVNPAFDGSRRAAGAFLRDAKGRTWLAHTGRVGGGKKGVGMTAFLEAFPGSVHDVEGRRYIAIGRIDAEDFLDELAAFVRTVQAFKAGIRGEAAGASDEDEEHENDDEDGDEDDLTDDASGLDAVLADTDAPTRRVLVQWLGDAIHHSHAQGASCWAITRRSGSRLRLLVGGTLAFEIGRNSVGVGLQLSSIPDSADAATDTDIPDYPFSRIDGVARWFSIPKFVAQREEFRPAAMRFIEQAASAYRRNPYARFHAPALLDAIAEAFGAPLPKPEHSVGAPSYWKVAPGERGRLWPRCRDGGYIAIGWDELGDLTGLDRDGFDARVGEALVEHPEWKRRGIEQAWRFLKIPVGARIVANDGTRRVLGIGTVTGPYRYEDDKTGFAHRLPVRWDDVRERVVEQPGWVRTLIQLTPAKFASIVNAPSPGEHQPELPPPEAKPEEKLDFDGIMDQLDDAGLRFPDEIVASYLLALQAKRFVILSGISGTGKTRLAQTIAKAFQPQDATSDLVPALEASPAETLTIRVQPYMLKFRRLVVPAVLAESVRNDAASGRVTVRFGEGQTESLRWSNASTATQLLFKGKFRAWFEQTFEPGDELELQLEGDDVPVLTISPGAAPSESAAPHIPTYSVIAVRPDWTDNRGLLGYYNPITREYHTTPFLRLLLAATEEDMRATREGEPCRPFFAVLDEMNLARVEHYFSDFLSCLESGEPLHLHDDLLVAEGGASETGETVPMQISIPRNLFFTGTVNVDETTYMFSPKVLDRAFVLEFNDVDLRGLGASADDESEGEASPLQLHRFAGALDIRDRPGPEDYARFRNLADGALHRALCSLNDRLQSEHRHFGYRVANEIARFVGLAETQAGKDPTVLWEALDVAVVAKVLPKLHGTQQEIEDVLQRMLAFAVDVESSVDAKEQESRWSYSLGRLLLNGEAPKRQAPRLPRAAAKLWRMLRRTRQQGYVSFIE